jgi:hypothetical protein
MNNRYEHTPGRQKMIMLYTVRDPSRHRRSTTTPLITLRTSRVALIFCAALNNKYKSHPNLITRMILLFNMRFDVSRYYYRLLRFVYRINMITKPF